MELARKPIVNISLGAPPQLCGTKAASITEPLEWKLKESLQYQLEDTGTRLPMHHVVKGYFQTGSFQGPLFEVGASCCERMLFVPSKSKAVFFNAVQAR